MSYTLRGFLAEYSSPELHTHSAHQALMIRNGVSLLEEATSRKPLYGSTCAFIPAGCPHRSVVVDGKIEYQSLYLEPAEYPTKRDRIVLFRLAPLARALFERIGDSQARDNAPDIHAECITLFLKLLGGEMKATALPFELPVASRTENKRAVRFLEDRHAGALRLEEAAAEAGLSVRQLERSFKADTGLTVFGYLRLYRIFSASVLLHDPKRKVIDVALSCGYSSLSSFYVDFRSVFSITPKAFRERVLGTS